MTSALAVALVFAVQQGIDSTTFANAATADLFFRARARHIRQDSLVHDYTARVRTRLEVRAGRSRFIGRTLMTHEAVADVTWREPNDLIVAVRGVRTAMPILDLLRGMGADIEGDVEDDIRNEVLLDRPWFVPRALGDSIRLMGVPDYAALHPLADDATEFYRYAIVDSASIAAQGVQVHAIKMRVEPRRYGPSLVAGDFWFDAATADLIRMQVAFVGEYLWEQPKGTTARDSAEARRSSRDADRVLSIEADLEYALVDGRYWMPHRQMLALTFDLPWLVNLSVPGTAVTAFTDYRVNVAPRLEFVARPDSADRREDGQLRRQEAWWDTKTPVDSADHRSDSAQARRGYYHGGPWSAGWWEVAVPPRDSLRSFTWDTPLQLALDEGENRYLRETFAELAHLQETLPDEWTGRPRMTTAIERLSDVFRFNRVQGASVGMGYQWRPGPPFVSVIGTARFGLSDHRPTGSLRLRRDGPPGRLDVLGFRSVDEVEPWTHGTSLGHSLNSVMTGHEYADFFLNTGGGLEYTFNHGLLRDVRVGAAYERHRSVQTATGSAIAGWWGEGALPPNPPVAEGGYFHGSLVRWQHVGPVRLGQGVDLLAGDSLTAGRAWGEVSTAFRILERSGRLTVRAGATRGDTMPQLDLRVGGLETVRGYPYGFRRGREFWAAQLDLALASSAIVTPVIFVDAGDTFIGDPLVSVGGGLSLLAGFLRLNLSKGVRPTSDLRFDIHFRAPR